MKRIMILFGLIVIITTLCLSGCYGYDYADPSEELVVFDGRNFSLYQYSGKAVIQLRYNKDKQDTLGLATTDYRTDEYWVHSAVTVLSGKFEDIGWHDFTLIISMDDLYYTFDINSYSISEANESTNMQEDFIQEWSKEEFALAYPDYETYDWWPAHG